MGSNGENLMYKIAYLEHALEKRDAKIQRLQSDLDECETNLVAILRENEGMIKQSVYDEMVINQSILKIALAECKDEIGEAKERYEKAEEKIQELKKKCENPTSINSFYEKKSQILDHQQNIDADDQLENISIATLDENSSSNNGYSPISGSISILSDQFCKNIAAHVAITQAAIGQFSSAYGLKISISDPPITSIDPNRRDSSSQTVVVSTNSIFCADCADLKVEIDVLNSEKKELEKELEGKRADLKRRMNQIKTSKGDMENLNVKIIALLKKLESMRNENKILKADKKKLKNENKSLKYRLDGGKSKNQNEIDSSESGTSIIGTPVKRKPSQDLDDSMEKAEGNFGGKIEDDQGIENGSKQDLLGVKFSIKGPNLSGKS